MCINLCVRLRMHTGPLRCRFLRRPENGRNQVRLFLRLSSLKEGHVQIPTIPRTHTRPGQRGRTQASNKTWISRVFAHNTRARKFLNAPSPPSRRASLSSLSFHPSFFLLCLILSPPLPLLPSLQNFIVCYCRVRDKGGLRN